MKVILLAAGKSSRMGVPKGLLKIKERYWIEEQLYRLSLPGIKDLSLVLGFYADQYFSSLPWLKEFEKEAGMKDGIHICVTINPEPSLGQFSSLLCGISKIDPCSRGAFILPIDVPCPHKEIWEKIIFASNEKPASYAFVPENKGRGGHPVFLSLEYLEKLSKLDPMHPESRLDFQLKSLAEDQIMRVNIPDEFAKEIYFNINTPGDWEKYLAMYMAK